MSFALDSDLDLAKLRLSQLRDPDPQATVRNLAERYIIELRPEAQRRSLAKLGTALGVDSVTLRVYVNGPTPALKLTASPTVQVTSPPPLIPTVQVTAQPARVTQAATQAATATPTATPARLDFQLFERVRLTCQQATGPKPRITIFVQDASGRGLPGVRVRVQWNDGEDTFFTGLKGSDPGYAEYEVQVGRSYSVTVLDGTSQVALGLSADSLDPGCANDGKEHFLAWRIIFRRLT